MGDEQRDDDGGERVGVKRAVAPNVYGNFDAYYGYRLAGVGDHDDDPRIALLPSDFFEGKYVLDIGCNVGLPTLTIAKKHRPKLIIGVDIDESLVRRARRSIALQYSLIEPEREMGTENVGERRWNYFPLSCPISMGTIPFLRPRKGEGFRLATAGPFPRNVSFWALDYLHDAHDEFFEGGFDIALAWSITKWIHLNWGDDGIKTFFKRINADLKPGGCLVLEPQEFSTYAKRKRLSEDLAKTYQTIQFKPDQFTDYLVNTLDFSEPTKVDVDVPTASSSKGFKRPLLIYRKRPVTCDMPNA